MALCNTQEIKQLEDMRLAIGAPEVCLNPGDDGKVHYLLGYCQGLFNQEGGSPPEHTNLVTRLLERVRAPMPKSHELFIGLKKRDVSIKEYLIAAAQPLLKDGRVPVIITMYDPATDMEKINELFSTPSPAAANHTILVRIGLGSRASFAPIAALMQQLHREAVRTGIMPQYWPLIQADFGVTEWQAFRAAVGEEVWKHVTIAATPFMPLETLKGLASNIAVYQFFVGRADDVKENGDVTVPRIACVGRAGSPRTYNVMAYAQSLVAFGLSAQVGIVCGQSQGWSQEENVERVRRYLPLLEQAVKTLWAREISEKVALYYAQPALAR